MKTMLRRGASAAARRAAATPTAAQVQMQRRTLVARSLRPATRKENQLQRLQQRLRASGAQAMAKRGFASRAVKKEVIPEILRAVSNTEEVEYYLDRFSDFEGSAFAVIKVGGDVVEYELDTLVQTCSILYKAGLKPVVIHGGGPQMNDELARKGVEPQYINGSRVTDEATLEVAQRIFTELNERVVKRMQQAGINAKAFPTGVFRAEVDKPELGFVGAVKGVNDGDIKQALEENVVPVLTSLGTSGDGQVLNINADVAARDLVHTLQPMRVMFASSKGGWLDDDTGKVVNIIDMANEYEMLASKDYEGRQGTLLKLNEIKRILDGVPSSTAVAITGADTMVRELFTHAGAGTLFTTGIPVQRIEGDASTPLLSPLPKGDAVVEATYIYGPSADKPYCAGRIVRLPKLGADLPPVLNEIVLSPQHHGNGYEHVLWKCMQRDFPSLAWTWTVEEAKQGSLKAGSSAADGTLCHWASDSNVAWYNRGHPLKGWSAEKAPRLVIDPPETKAVKYAHEYTPNANPVKVGLLGARGYVGREFVKLLTDHPNMELTVASSRALSGQRVIDCFGLDKTAAVRGVADTLRFNALEPEDLAEDDAAREVDIWVLALPNGLAPKFVDALEKFAPDSTMIDLGADYRFDDSWVYGLPERPGAREALKGAKRISNPGCYASALQLALMPIIQPMSGGLLKLQSGTVPSSFGVSGYSGAGTNPSDKNDPQVLKDNIIPYSLVSHMHERECTKHLGSQVAFMPHVASWFQGIHMTSTVHIEPTQGGNYPSTDEIRAEFQEYYKDEPLVKVTKEAPTVRDNMFRHHGAVGGFTLDQETGRLVVVSTVDNLNLGAATHCTQNLNIAFGFDELAGIDLD
ncbi:Protein ARG5,6, mitochondrial [Hondaea fermentalgiana]|uniref:acetylglutamate kinase n=1 Tax=Hondaea fermentalgiana TaxID=2315210 RepID=A0A2R5GN40_9STRA|nr:Protein ARG5,6, mitochondrial [Hondaea fermentalgiana]|eukprot:GBG32306.1 Protein ARG5,6, mitochondrial [Hondaea fermentalgiana]